MMWLVGALYGGYVMANMLKWYWWRFNGYGYFWGMLSGMLTAMFVPESLFSAALPNLFGPQCRQHALPVPDHPGRVRGWLRPRHLSDQAGGRRHFDALLQDGQSLGRVGADPGESHAGRPRISNPTPISGAIRSTCWSASSGNCRSRRCRFTSFCAIGNGRAASSSCLSSPPSSLNSTGTTGWKKNPSRIHFESFYEVCLVVLAGLPDLARDL